MKIKLEESIDFNWIKKGNVYGFFHTLPELNDGTILRRIISPSKNQVVLSQKDNSLVPVIVLDGQYEVNGRLSNFWHWREIKEDLTLSEEKSGYGEFYKPHINFEVKQTFSISTK